ncbi:MAG: toll/interleukin-1 receptor domain-containing protein [Desulfobacteraceae bacterium]
MDTFISYATEDEQVANEIAGILKSKGFSVWYAPMELEIGDTLLSKINEGLKVARSGILLVSPEYIKKQWTNYELDVLFRQHIEIEKRIYPIWHKVDKLEVEQWHPGLSGVIAIKTSEGYVRVGETLCRALAKNCQIWGVAPTWESPYERFLKGDGELHANHPGKGCFTIWEALEFDDSMFPIWIDGKQYNPEELAFRAAQTLAHRREVAVRWVGEERVQSIEKRCTKLGFNPYNFE